MSPKTDINRTSERACILFLSFPYRCRLRIHAQSDPPDIPKEEKQQRGRGEWFQNILSRFGPITGSPQITTVLDFEKPLVELDNRIKEVTSARRFSLLVAEMSHAKEALTTQIETPVIWTERIGRQHS